MPEDVRGDAVDVLLELPGEAALADAAGAGDGEEPGAAVTPDRGQGVLDQTELVLAPDEGWLGQVRAPMATALRDDSQGPPGGHRAGLALEHVLTRFLEDDGRGGGALRRLADKDGAGRRDALQPRGGIDEVARDHALVGGPEGDRRLAGQDAGTRRDAGAQHAYRLDQVERGANGALGVVLTSDRCAPDGHDRVADELLDRAAIASDHVPREFEVGGERLAHLLRVALLGEGREADEIREKHAHQAPFGSGGL